MEYSGGGRMGDGRLGFRCTGVLEVGLRSLMWPLTSSGRCLGTFFILPLSLGGTRGGILLTFFFPSGRRGRRRIDLFTLKSKVGGS